MKHLLTALIIMFSATSCSYGQSTVLNYTSYKAELNVPHNVTVSITPVTDKVKSTINSDAFDGFLIKNADSDYTIYIQRGLSSSKAKKTLSHEVKHIKQFESGRLQQLNQFVFVFEGDTVNVRRTDYYQRPWERDVIQ